MVQRRSLDGVALFVSAVSAVLGLERLGHNSLANDEATSFFIAQLDWQRMFQSFSTSEANGSPFYTALHFWKVFGESEQTLRLLPWLFGIGVPYLLFRVLVRLFDRPLAFAGSLLLAVNAFFISNLQDLRTYSLSVLLATSSTLAFVKWVEGRNPGQALAYVGLAALSVYAHFLGTLVLTAHALSLFARPSDERLKDVTWVYLPIGVLLLPVAGFVLFSDVGQIDWINDPSVRQVSAALQQLVGRGGPIQLVLYALLVAGAVAGTGRVLRSHGRSRDAWRHSLIVLWAGLPIVVTLLVSTVKPMFQARYVLVSLPAVAACGALGISWLASMRPVLRVVRWNVPVFVAGVVVATAVTAGALPGWYSGSSPYRWDAKANVVLEGSRPEDAVLFYAPTVIRPFGYYAGLYTDRDPSLEADDILYPPVDWLGFSKTRFDPPLRLIEQGAAVHERVWLVKGAAADETRRAEMDELVGALEGRCGAGRKVAPGVVLFSECRA